ncbi:hypothetical protein CDAR_507811 [Caerostris darwini]|uniref:Uncharacterized protein n=1 Tax=Caerostris darwini TaxID=1538125 RepID=A0AAV4QYT3_9ARAC|nr:hypothetical protein CDAR_507811 [Caerostris darwini]
MPTPLLLPANNNKPPFHSAGETKRDHLNPKASGSHLSTWSEEPKHLVKNQRVYFCTANSSPKATSPLPSGNTNIYTKLSSNTDMTDEPLRSHTNSGSRHFSLGLVDSKSGILKRAAPSMKSVQSRAISLN